MGYFRYRPSDRKWGNDLIPAWVVYTAFIVAIVNFVTYAVIASIIGGDAMNGYAAGGHYFLGNKGHFTEVSRGLWEYSKWHTVSIFVTHPLAFIVGVVGRSDPESPSRPPPFNS